MEAHFQRDTDQVIEICYLGVENMPSRDEGLFGCICDGRVVVGGGKEDSTDVFELIRGGKWKTLPSRNISRTNTASCYINHHLFVTGGCITYTDLHREKQGYISDHIEILEISNNHTGDHWTTCSSKLPFEVSDHTINSFNNQLLMIGGTWGSSRYDNYSGPHSNEVWLGEVEHKVNYLKNLVETSIVWKKLNSMNEARKKHFSIVVDRKVYVFGGEMGDKANYNVEIFDGENWEIGPKCPFHLNSYNAQAGLDDKKRIIIVSENHGIIVYNTQTGNMNANAEFRMKDDRNLYASLFL